jgi:CBS domain-containing protein
MTKCSDLMGRVTWFCLSTDTVFKVSQTMKNHNLSAVPVVRSEENHELIGLVAERDIALRVVGESLPPQTEVREIMTVNLTTCGPEDDIEKAVNLMADFHIHHLPIVDEKGQIIGMIDRDMAA